MASVTDAPQNPIPFSRRRSNKTVVGRAILWLRANLFGSISSSIVSLLLIAVLSKAFISLMQWGFLNAVWTVPGGDRNACGMVRGLGACWAAIPETLRFILSGPYPCDQDGRPALALVVFTTLFYVSAR